MAAPYAFAADGKSEGAGQGALRRKR